MRRSPIWRSWYNCSDYREPDECGKDVKCYYDYDEKECRNKRSPTTFTGSLYYRVSERLPTAVTGHIHSYLIGSPLRLVDYYPHNPQYILRNISRVPDNKVVEFLNYLPDDIDPFAKLVYAELKKRYDYPDLIEILKESENNGLALLDLGNVFSIDDILIGQLY